MLEPMNDNTRHIEELLNARRYITRRMCQLRQSKSVHLPEYISQWQQRLWELDEIIDELVPPLPEFFKQ